MTVTPNPTLRPDPPGVLEGGPAETPRRPTRNPPDAEVHADVDAGVVGRVDARNPPVIPAVAEPYHWITQMNPASWVGRESRASLVVSGRRQNAGYIRYCSTRTGFSASRVPGSIQRVVELRSRVPIGALAPLYDQAGRAAP